MDGGGGMRDEELIMEVRTRTSLPAHLNTPRALRTYGDIYKTISLSVQQSKTDNSFLILKTLLFFKNRYTILKYKNFILQLLTETHTVSLSLVTRICDLKRK